MPVRNAVWHHWVFVDSSNDAPNFEEFVAPLGQWLGDIDFSNVQHLVTIDLGEVRVNWKLLMENFIESYHVQLVHSTTTDQPLADHFTVNKSGWLGSAFDVKPSSDKPKRRNALSVSSRFLTLFPKFVLGRYFADQPQYTFERPACVVSRESVFSWILMLRFNESRLSG